MKKVASLVTKHRNVIFTALHEPSFSTYRKIQFLNSPLEIVLEHILNQEVITRRLQLPHIPVMAFSQTDLYFLV